MYDIFERLLQERGLTHYKVWQATGVAQSSLSEWKAGKSKPGPDSLAKLADYFGVSVDYLMGREDDIRKAIAKISNGPEDIIRFPVYGTVAAGYGGMAVREYTGDFEYIPKSELRGSPEDYFVLRVKGDSMYPKLLDGDNVLVRQTPTVESGKIAIVVYDSDEATIKRVNYVYGEDWVELIPANPEYQTKRIEGAGLEQCRVLGEVVKLIRDL